MPAPRPPSRRARLVGAAILIPVLVALESLPVSSPSERGTASGDLYDASPALPALPAEPACPAGALPDQGVCIPVPPAEAFVPASTSHLGLMPGRLEDYASYLTPISGHRATADADGHGMVIPASPRTVVTLISLEHQVGAARRVVLQGPEPRLLTVHRVSRHAVTRTYVLSYEGLTFDVEASDADVAVGTPLGRVSASPGSHRAALRLAVRQLRRGAHAEQLPARRLLSDAVSLACDPRNVLPMKPAPSLGLALPGD